MTKQQKISGLSAVIIALNEEKNIERAIKSLDFVDEVVIYDSGSTDKTIEIAQNLGAKVHQGPWLGFGLSKRKVVELASHDWVLSLDSDEEVSMELKLELIEQFKSFQVDTLYSLPRLSFYLGRWIRHGGWYPDRQARLFNRTYYQWNADKIHEKVVALNKGDVKIQKLKKSLLHYVFKNIEHQVQTNNKYSSLQAQRMWDQGKNFSWFHFLTKPYVKFIECYFWKLGFLDGWAGYLIARSAAYSVLLKWAKLKEIQKKEQDPS